MHHGRRSFVLAVLLIACLALFARAGRAQEPPIVFSEILVGNAATTLDTDYTNFSGWIELRNNTGSTINLSNYKFDSLRDGATTPDTFTIKTKLNLPAGGRLILWADENKKGPHLPFELDMDGGELSLFNPAGQLVTSLVYGKQSPDVSYGRAPDNSDTWAFFDQPTPGQPNDTPAFANNSAASFAARPQFSVAGGLHSGPLSVELASTDPGATIRYTTDSSRPTTSSPLYTGPIAVNGNTVIRARAWAAGKMVSPTATQTYLINVPTNLPIISLVLDPPYLWDSQIGFYVKGSNGVNGCRGKANWHQKWERPGNFEFYEKTGENRLNQEVGVDISGNCTRNLPQKSFEIKARKLYGDNDMDYAFFDDKPMTSYKRLILRSGGQDNSRAYMRDALAQNLSIGRMDLDRQAYRPAVVYLNGQYWGLYNMREKMDEDYVENNYDLDEEDFDMVELNGRLTSGSLTAWESFYDFIKSVNIASSAGYDAVKERMDVNSFIDYIILQTYVANTDWPRNNTRWWDDHGNQYTWRWVLKDLDFAFLSRNLKRDMIAFLIKGKAPTTVVFNNLWDNADFRNEFAQRYAVHLNTTFLPANVIGLIDEMANGIRAEIPAQTARWGGKPGSLAVWEAEVQELRTLAAQRPAYALSTLRKRIGNPADATLTINIDGNGRVLVAGAEVPDGYSGPHFRGIPMTLTAVPAPGALFGYWLETGETSATITIPFAGDTTRTAVFGEEPPPPPPPDLVINEIHYQPTSPQDEANNEFLEVFSNETEVVDLGGFTIPAISFTFPPGSTIAPGEFIVVAANSADPAYAAMDPDDVFDFAWGSLDNQKLSNGGEQVTLIDTYSQTVDSVNYDDVAPWPTSPDGTGPSLALNDPANDNSLPANWAASRENGGTPGAVNFPPLPPVPPLVINELNYHPTGGAAEFIELFNNSANPVVLDGLTFEGLDYTFPLSTTLSAGGYLVIAAPGHSYSGALTWASGDLDDAGETITLKDGFGQVVDTITYGVADPWPTTPNGSGPSLSLRDPAWDNSQATSWAASTLAGGTPGAENFPTLPLVINEIHYNPIISPTVTAEFIEIVNTGPTAAHLGGFTLEGVDFTFPVTTTLSAGGYLVIAAPGHSYPDALTWTSGDLDDAGETITLKDAFGQAVDVVTYGVADPWPTTPNGSGPSLSLKDPALDNTEATNWSASTLTGGTPGEENP